jgi:aminoglycoside 3-N-acetyltransferase
MVMVHTRMSAIGWVVGGSQTVVEALLAVLGPDGTLMAYAGWEDDLWHLAEWPDAWREAYRAGLPPFDPGLSEADHGMGRLPERIRTWPGAQASTAHVMRMVAIGAQAGWLTRDQSWGHPQGPGSPLAKLVAADGQVLMLGAPLSTLTLLHHAEALAARAGASGKVGDAESHLFEARPLVDFALGWLQTNFGGRVTDAEQQPEQ